MSNTFNAPSHVSIDEHGHLTDVDLEKAIEKATGATATKITLIPPPLWDPERCDEIDTIGTFFIVQETPDILSEFKRAILNQTADMQNNPHGITALITFVKNLGEEYEEEVDAELNAKQTRILTTVMASIGWPEMDRVIVAGTFV